MPLQISNIAYSRTIQITFCVIVKANWWNIESCFIASFFLYHAVIFSALSEWKLRWKAVTSQDFFCKRI